MAVIKAKWGITQNLIYSSILPLIRQAGLSAITVNLPPNLFATFDQDVNLGEIVFHKVEDIALSNQVTFSDGIESITFN